MKLKLLTPVLCCLTALSISALADDGSGDGQGDNNQGDCGGNQSTNSSGSEEFEATVTLVATTNAPSGATGVARLEEESEDGSVDSSLKVTVQGLDAGDYTLSAVKISDGSSEQLAQFTVGSISDGDDNEDNGEEGGFWGWLGGGWQGGNTNSWQGGDTNNMCTNMVVLVGFVRTSLPSDLDATNIAQLVVADTNGNALLVGDFQNPAPSTSLSLKETVTVVGGPAAPQASGTAVFQRLISRGHKIEHFTMSANGVPVSSSFAVHVNGKAVTHVRSTKHGIVSLKKLPGKPRIAPSVLLVNKHGESVAAAHF